MTPEQFPTELAYWQARAREAEQKSHQLKNSLGVPPVIKLTKDEFDTLRHKPENPLRYIKLYAIQHFEGNSNVQNETPHVSERG